MKHFGLNIAEGTGITNLTLPSGTVDPTVSPNAGEMFYRTDLLAPRIHNGTSWGSLGGISNVVEDLTPQLGGSLDVNGKNIISSSGGSITINPDSPGQIALIAIGSSNINIENTATGQMTLTSLNEITLTCPTLLVRTGSGAGGQGTVKFEEAGNGGGAYVALSAPAVVTASRTWALPQDNPTNVMGQFITTDSSGVLSFESVNSVSAARLYFSHNT